MFRKKNENLDLEGIDDFIEKPSQDCKIEDIEIGVNKILIVLAKNPAAIMRLLTTKSPIL